MYIRPKKVRLKSTVRLVWYSFSFKKKTTINLSLTHSAPDKPSYTRIRKTYKVRTRTNQNLKSWKKSAPVRKETERALNI